MCGAALLYYGTHPGATLGNSRGCSLVVNYWADLQLVHEFRCEMSATALVLALWLVSRICYRSEQTDRQTDRHADRNTSDLSRDEVIKVDG